MAGARPKLIWSRLAFLDLERAHAMLAARSAEAALRLATDVVNAVDRLRQHPELGAVARDVLPEGKYRHLVVGRHRVIYRLTAGAVVILRVWDGRRNPANLRA